MTLFGQMRGGVQLTDAALNYYYALKRVEGGPREEVLDLLAGTLQELEKAMREAQKGVVWQVASALRIMVLFHAGHGLFQREQESLVVVLGKEWQRLKQLLSVLSGHLEVEVNDHDSLGLGDITPHPSDVQLEERTLHG